MAPFNPNTEKRKGTGNPSSAKCGIAKRVLKKTTRGGTRSSGADEADLQDRFSALPDNMLCCILTLLSVHDAARTAVLSNPWRHLFSSPECQSDTIDDKYVCHAWRCDSWSRRMWKRRSRGITSALAASLDEGRRPIRRFIVQRTLPSYGEVSGWLNTLSQRGDVEEIVLKMPYLDVCLPHFIFNCSSLRSLSLYSLHWPLIGGPNGAPAGYVPSWMLPLLTELTLCYMNMAMQDIEELLRRCPALLSLSICYPLQHGSLIIQCENLLSLTIQDGAGGGSYDEVSIVHAPKLERLLLCPDPLCLGETHLEALPRLHTVGIFKQYVLKVALEQVRTIALITNLDNSGEVQQAIELLHKFPRLETLHIQVECWGSTDTKSKPTSLAKMAGGPVECLEKTLKTIVLRVSNLSHRKLAFANFLLGAAKALKLMLIWDEKMGNSKKMCAKLLRQESRASPAAQVVFQENSNYAIEIDISASNYKLADPFMP